MMTSRRQAGGRETTAGLAQRQAALEGAGATRPTLRTSVRKSNPHSLMQCACKKAGDGVGATHSQPGTQTQSSRAGAAVEQRPGPDGAQAPVRPPTSSTAIRARPCRKPSSRQTPSAGRAGQPHSASGAWTPMQQAGPLRYCPKHCPGRDPTTSECHDHLKLASSARGHAPGNDTQDWPLAGSGTRGVPPGAHRRVLQRPQSLDGHRRQLGRDVDKPVLACSALIGTGGGGGQAGVAAGQAD